MNDLILLLIRNFKQNRSRKKLSHNFIESFRMKNKINEQTYCFILCNIYRIYNLFYILFLKLYLHRANDAKTKTMMQASKFIDDMKQ